jgi:hypothetical protein
MMIYKPERLIYNFDHGVYAVDVWHADGMWQATATQVDAVSTFVYFHYDESQGREAVIQRAITGVKEHNEEHN